MSNEALDLADFILDIQAEIIAPGAHMPTVDAAAAAMKVVPEQIFKSILFQAKSDRLRTRAGGSPAGPDYYGI